MALYGITENGFVPKPRASIYAELCASAITASGDANLDVSADSDIGVLLGVFADALGGAWEASEGVYQESYPDGATGVPLENLCALTGVTRLAATYSEVNVTLTGTPAAIIPLGTLLDMGTGTKQVALMADTTIGGASTVVARCKATESGPNYFLAGTINHIGTPVTGLTSVSNALDQDVLGTNIESYEDLRVRRVATLHAMGGSAVDAIRAHVSLVDGVTECYVLNNDTNGIVDTMPAHSFEVVVRGGTDAAVAAVILDTKPVGVYSAGSTSVNTPDDLGVDRTVRMTRPSSTPIYLAVEVETWGVVPSGLADSIKAAIVAQQNAYHVGNDFVCSRFVRPIFDVSTTIQNVAHVYAGTAINPTTSATVAIGNRNYAALDTTRIAVTITALGSV